MGNLIIVALMLCYFFPVAGGVIVCGTIIWAMGGSPLLFLVVLLGISSAIGGRYDEKRKQRKMEEKHRKMEEDYRKQMYGENHKKDPWKG
ncbi:hypothetical protein [Methylobacter sp.]|uniref:hypothetical protein n=1 Tax=Methylobacter sp. TaxID=2051955 RepID=UPI003DA5C0A1